MTSNSGGPSRLQSRFIGAAVAELSSLGASIEHEDQESFCDWLAGAGDPVGCC